MTFRFLFYFTSLIFIGSLVLIVWPIPLFKKPKPLVTVLLLDVSKSIKLTAQRQQKIMSQVSGSLEESDFFVCGYYANQVIFRDTEPQTLHKQEVQKPLHDWLNDREFFSGYLDLNVTDSMAAVMQTWEDWSRMGSLNVILVTDCLDNKGQISLYRKFSRNKDISLTAIYLEESPKDLFIKEINAPKTIVAGQAFTIDVKILSNVNEEHASLQIWIQDKKILDKVVRLKEGENRYAIQAFVEQDGLYEVRAISYFKDDFIENNQLSVQIKTSNHTQVLIVSDENHAGLASFIPTAKTISPIHMPTSMDGYIGFNGVVLDNVHWNKIMDTGKLEALADFVRRGGRLFVSGGDHSFGFGDYIGTSLEKLLPVKINPNGLVSMLVAIDMSGSMESDVGGMRKIDIAINSLLEISRSLEPKDQLGVHLYNENKEKEDLWIPLLEREKFNEELNQKLKELPKPTGGTFIIPALQTMYRDLIKDERLLRIAVLISDGETNEKDFDAILKQFKDANPPISFILIGADLSEESPLWTAGKNVFGNDWQPANINKQGWINLKECFQEALRKVASGFSDKGEFKIYVNQAYPLSRNVQPFEGKLNGIILKTGLKPDASVLLDIDDRLPLAAHRYYGNGEVISFHSGFAENWAGSWLNSPQGNSFQDMICSWLQEPASADTYVQISQDTESPQMVIFSSRPDLKNTAELILEVEKKQWICVRDSNFTWSARVFAKDFKNELSNKPFKIFQKDAEQKILIQDGLLPLVLSNEILDLHRRTSKVDIFKNSINHWVSEGENVKPSSKRLFAEAYDVKDFFYLALISFLLSLFFRYRSH